MIDLPANFNGDTITIDIKKLKEKVADYAPAVNILRETWNRETLAQMAEGKIFVPQETINEYIAERLNNTANSPVKEITVAAHKDGILDINAVTKNDDKLLLSGTIETFSQKDGRALFNYRVKKHKLPGHGLTSWIFSNVSLSMAQKLFGKVQINDELPVTIKHDTVQMDLSEVLAASAMGKTEIAGHKVTEILEIENAVPKEGGIEIDTKLHVSDDLKKILLNIIKK